MNETYAFIERVSRKHVARVVREHGIQGVTPRRRGRWPLTRPDKRARPAPGPDRPRRPRRASRHQAGRGCHCPAHRRGLALPRLLARPT